MVEGARLEIVYAATYRGFESRPLRQEIARIYGLIILLARISRLTACKYRGIYRVSTSCAHGLFE